MSRWIGVDLDGTLAHSDADTEDGDVGRPIMPMVNRVKGMLDQGKDVRIFTARLAHKKNLDSVKQWSKKHLGRELPITNVKDGDMETLYDDRAVGVVRNEGVLIGGERDGSAMDRLKKDLRSRAK